VLELNAKLNILEYKKIEKKLDNELNEEDKLIKKMYDDY
jgi:hypothetical protein